MIIAFTKLKNDLLCVLCVYPEFSNLGKQSKISPILSKYKCTKAKVMHIYHMNDINSPDKELFDTGVDFYDHSLIYQVGKVLELEYNDPHGRYITFFLLEELAYSWKNLPLIPP